MDTAGTTTGDAVTSTGQAVTSTGGSGETTPGGRFLPLTLWRRGTIAVRDLDGLVPARTWELLDEGRRRRAELTALGTRLGETLHDLVPRLGPAPRRAALAVRRAVHNHRPPSPNGVAQLRDHLDPDSRELLDRYLRCQADDEQARAEAEDTFRTEIAACRRRLAELGADENLRRGLQLSGRELARNVAAFSREVAQHGRTPKRLRTTESTLVSYLYRVALKPSPFASFTDIGAHPWHPPTVHGGPEPDGQRVRQVRFSRGVLNWMAGELHRVPGSADILELRLANTAVLQDGRVHWFRRGPDGTDQVFGGEKFASLPVSDAVRVVLDALGDGPRRQAQVLAALRDAGAGAEQAEQFVQRLVDIGLCECGFGIPDQETDPAPVIASRLRQLPGARAAECAAVFEELRRGTADFAESDSAGREKVLDAMAGQVETFTATFGMPAPPGGVVRTMVFEDVGNHGPSRSWDAGLLERNAAMFDRLLRLLPVLDDGQIEKLGLYTFFEREFGTDAAGIDLLTCYRRFAKLDPPTVTALMTGRGDRHADGVRAARRDLGEVLAASADALPDPGEALGDHDVGRGPDGGRRCRVSLDPGWVDEFLDRLPPWLPGWSSAAFRVQFEPGPPPAVALNGVTTGHGAFFSRFCDLLEPCHGGWSLRTELAGWIAGRTPRQADLTAVLDMNFNLHPRLTPFEVVYPGSIPAPGAERVLTLRDLHLVADPVARRVRVVNRRDGQPLDLVPLNFLFPAAGPSLYRFLFLLTTTGTYRGGLWSRLLPGSAVGRRPHRPGVRLGDLVLEREAWSVPAREVPVLDERDGAAGLLAVEKWRTWHGLPRECFFQVRAPAAPTADLDWMDEVRNWALSARRARLHKPHFCDFRSPFLLRILGRQAAAVPDGVVTFTECLPATTHYRTDGAPAPEEFIVERYA